MVEPFVVIRQFNGNRRVKMVNPNREIKSGGAAAGAVIIKCNKNNILSELESISVSPAEGFVDVPHFRFCLSANCQSDAEQRLIGNENI